MLVLLVLASPLWAQRSDDSRGFDHVFVIMMENTGYDSLIGNANAPFINFAPLPPGWPPTTTAWRTPASRITLRQLRVG
jgi:hypothetical protein